MIRNIIKKILDLPSLRFGEKYIVFLSDDWGSVRMKSKDDRDSLKDLGLKLINRFNRFDGLETNKDLELLFEVLYKYKDSTGRHPVITAVSNVANPDFNAIKELQYQEYIYETVDKTYLRYPQSDRVLNLITEGIESGIFVPQFHGREHLQFEWWMKELAQETSFARAFFDHEFYFLSAAYLRNPKRNRGIGAAFDVWDENDLKIHKNVINDGIKIFSELYGSSPQIFTPPAIYYHPHLENILFENGIKWLDVGRVFKTPKIGGGEKLQINYLGKKRESGLKVLVRNAVFETNMSDNDNGVSRCLRDIEQAFSKKLPAIISNHRASFTGRIEESNRGKGLKALDILFSEILIKWPDVRFISGSEL